MWSLTGQPMWLNINSRWLWQHNLFTNASEWFTGALLPGQSYLCPVNYVWDGQMQWHIACWVIAVSRWSQSLDLPNLRTMQKPVGAMNRWRCKRCGDIIIGFEIISLIPPVTSLRLYPSISSYPTDIRYAYFFYTWSTFQHIIVECLFLHGQILLVHWIFIKYSVWFVDAMMLSE